MMSLKVFVAWLLGHMWISWCFAREVAISWRFHLHVMTAGFFTISSAPDAAVVRDRKQCDGKAKVAGTSKYQRRSGDCRIQHPAAPSGLNKSSIMASSPCVAASTSGSLQIMDREIQSPEAAVKVAKQPAAPV
ncbi:hypothetical protein NDU88_007280 [Pleurodeles waltl]|uniref:Secreted protein n=1 Tax=Pleurodeles waltl TaxID=8319 RepID=A0AAV7U0T3_PLEWA|nr:hypothetical protein NDU88_007280 [Pleurodeles waltl]